MDTNRNLKRVQYLFLVSCLFFTCSSADSLNYKSVGFIIGPDYSSSPCSGGWKITIDNKTYNFEMPSNSDITETNTKFPLRVKLNWELDKGSCNWIRVSKIKKI
jgi:hypothetical protein